MTNAGPKDLIGLNEAPVDGNCNNKETRKRTFKKNWSPERAMRHPCPRVQDRAGETKHSSVMEWFNTYVNTATTNSNKTWTFSSLYEQSISFFFLGHLTRSSGGAPIQRCLLLKRIFPKRRCYLIEWQVHEQKRFNMFFFRALQRTLQGVFIFQSAQNPVPAHQDSIEFGIYRNSHRRSQEEGETVAIEECRGPGITKGRPHPGTATSRGP